MSDYSATFPSQRPVYSQDFAQSGKLDPRATFTRASTGTYFGTDKVLGSENLILQSENFTTTWTIQDASGAAGATAPDGGTDGYTITTNSGSSKGPRVSQSLSGKLSTSTQYTMVGHVKAGTATHGFISFRGNNSNNYAYAQIQFSSPGSVSTGGAGFSGISGTVTALGSSWYKLTLTATTGSNVSGAFAFLGVNDGTAFGISGYPVWTSAGETLEVWGAQLSTTGNKVYDSPTTTQIARSYQTKLQTAASGAARFETATDGQSEGILIEGQSTNLVTYSETLPTGWTEGRSTLTAASGVAPDGTLTSNLFTVDGTAADSHNAYFEYASGGATPQTFSIFAKKGSANYIALRYGPTHGTFADGYAFFDLSNGTKGRVTAAITASSIVDCGNGWYRCSITNTALQSGTARAIIYVAKEDNTFSFDGNSYDHIQVWGAQIEANQSFASSYIKSNSGSTTTRAKDQLDITDASLFSGNEGTIAFEGQTLGGSTGFGRFWAVSDGTNDNRIHVYPTSSTAVRFRVYRNNIEQRNVASGVTDVTQSNRYAFAYEDNKLRLAQNGSLLKDDSNSAVMPVVNKLSIGMNGSGSGNQMNGYIKRISFYNQSLSDTEMTSLSS